MAEIQKIVIIGSGPAGLTAALYCARMGLEPLVINGPLPGGQLMTTFLVENWPGEKQITGPELIQNMRDHAHHFGTRFIDGIVTKITTISPFTITLNDSSSIQSHSVIIASGARPRRLNCPGEEQYWGRGVSSCAICDGAFFKDKTVLVVGGGNSALEQATFLSQFTPHIILVHHKDQLSATESHLKKEIAQLPNLRIIFKAKVEKITGNNERVTHAIIKHTNTNTEESLAVDGIFIAIGTQANSSFLPPEIAQSPQQQILFSQATQTTVQGIFAAGDVTINAYRQAITASSGGCKAALDAQKYLKKSGILLN